MMEVWRFEDLSELFLEQVADSIEAIVVDGVSDGLADNRLGFISKAHTADIEKLEEGKRQ